MRKLVLLAVILIMGIAFVGCQQAGLTEQDRQQEQRIKELETQIAELKNQIAEQTETIKSLTSERDALVAERATMQSQLEKARASYLESETTLSSVQAQLAIAQREKDSLQTELAQVKNQLALALTTTPAPTPAPTPTPTPTPTSDTESVSVYKILDFDRAMIIRENGEAWILEKGVGCLSLDFYEGRRILIYSPGLFAGVGSKIIVPDRDQVCRIWDAEFLGIKLTIIESHINGTFEGWDGDTVFELRNGQIWQQASYSYTYHYAYSPEVFIYSTSSGYKMIVNGVSETIYVRRLK